MLELIERTHWDQAYDFLSAGDPPMVFRIMALNTVFLILYVVRRAGAARPMDQSGVVIVQSLLVGANLLVMFQHDIVGMLQRLI